MVYCVCWVIAFVEFVELAELVELRALIGLGQESVESTHMPVCPSEKEPLFQGPLLSQSIPE